jgi:hypothetical protein
VQDAIEQIRPLTAKTPRARREDAMNETSVQEMPRIHEAQLLTYLKLSGHRLGFLVNWNVALIKDGIERMVNGL